MGLWPPARPASPRRLTPLLATISEATRNAVTDAALKAHIDTVVVIYAENRSFNNLFADFPGLERPLNSVPRSATLQKDRDGSILEQLPPVWEGLVPFEQTVEGHKYIIGSHDLPPRPPTPPSNWKLRGANLFPTPS